MSFTDFFKSKSIFITGGSGFIGKVIIEKLLRTYDGIEKIYVLLREKKNKSPKERIEEIVKCEIFKVLNKTNPEAIKKLVPIYGDVTLLKLGLSDEDMQNIIENVDIIYHGAASVRFDDHLKDSVLLNTRGTKELVDIALQGKKLITFLHISTTYCNTDKKYIEEKIYPAHADWRNTITLAEQADERVLTTLTTKYIYPLPNTYTFSKSLAEHVVHDLCKGKILAAIVRPSIVVSTQADPFPGFIDNFNGPVGLLSAGGKGLLKISYGDENAMLNFIPVDIFVQELLLITYDKTLSRVLNEVPVYNTTAHDNARVSNRDLIELGARLTWDVPFTTLMWNPSFSMTNNFYKYYIIFLLYHMLPALFYDGLLKLSGRKPMVIKIQRKIYVANLALAYFMKHSWTFVNEKCLALSKEINKITDKKFYINLLYDSNEEDVYNFYLHAKLGTETLFKDKFDRDKGFRNTMILWVLDYLLHFTIIGILGWYCVVKLEIFTIITNLINQYLMYLSKL